MFIRTQYPGPHFETPQDKNQRKKLANNMNMGLVDRETSVD